MGTTRRFMIALVVLLSVGSLASAQDIWRSVASGNWGATATWERSTDGGATWAAPTSAPATRDTASKFIIAAGHTVVVEASPKYCNDLLVEAGATLTANVKQPTSDIRYIRIKGDTLTVNGVFGFAANPADSSDVLSLQPYGPNSTLLIHGSGTINICRIRPHTDRTNITVVFDANVTMTYIGSSGTGGAGIYASNNANNDNITFTVNTGRTLTLVDKCNLATSSSTSTDGTANTTFNIDGTVNMLGGNLNLRAAAGKTCALNVAGTLNVGGSVYPTGTTGVTSTITVNGTMNTGTLGQGTLYFDTPAQVVTGPGTFTVGSGATFRTGLAAGMPAVNGQIQTTTALFSPGATFAFVGTSAQVTGALLPPKVRGLLVDNTAGVTLTQATLVDSTLTLTNGALVSDTLGVAVGPGGIVVRTNGHVDGYLAKAAFTGAKSFEVGTAGGYSPVIVTAADTGDFVARAIDGAHPNLADPTRALGRSWSLISSGIDAADLTFVYPLGDVNGDGASYVAGRNTTGKQWATYPTAISVSGDSATVTGITAFSAWTLGERGAFTGFDDPPSLAVKNALQPVVLDGKLDEAEWATAPTLAYGNGAFLKKGPGEKTVTGSFDIKATFDYWDQGVFYGTFKMPNADSSLAKVKFMRKGMNLYIGLQSDDKSICKFDWEGDGIFLKIKRANGTDAEYKLYYQNIGTAADTIRYEPPAVGHGAGAGYLPAGSTVNDTSNVDNGYSAELMIRLDSLGYTSVLDTVKLALVVFDPDGYQHPMNSYDTTAGTYFKSWWGSEWGGVYRSLLFTAEPVKFDDPDTLFANLSSTDITVDGDLNEPGWATAATLAFGNGAFLKKGPGEKTVTGEFDIKATFDYWDQGVFYGTFKMPNTDSSLARVKFLRRGANLYVGLQSDDKSICKFDWEGDGIFLKIKRANGTDAEYKLYYQNIGTAADTIRYEPPAAGYGAGAGKLGAGSKVNDTSAVDNGYSAELMIRLDSLGYGPTAKGVQMALVVFDPDGYQHPMNSYDTTAGTFYKSWWGSEWGGVWRVVAFDNLTDVGPAAEDQIPTQFALHQNYPNPFNPSTNIRFDVPAKSLVRIAVYDVTGREVATLVNGEHVPGSYRAVLDGTRLASGVYFYRMMASGVEGGQTFVSTNKLILLK